MTEDRRDLVTAGALDVHEVAVGVLHEALQLVLALLVFGARMEQIFRELKKVTSILDTTSTCVCKTYNGF